MVSSYVRREGTKGVRALQYLSGRARGRAQRPRAPWPSASVPAAPASRWRSSTPTGASYLRWATVACRSSTCSDGSGRQGHSAKKELRDFGGRTFVLEPAITGDYAIVKAWKGDRFGNLVYRHTAMNFNPMIATAAQGDDRRRSSRFRGGRRARPRADPHARHLRAPPGEGRGLREAHRASHAQSQQKKAG